VVWAIEEDHVNRDLLFVGTEFGLFFTVDGGKHWVQLRGGAPTIPFRDLEVQRHEDDLVAATFGRGIYVLDDYSPLRHLTGEALRDGALFPPRKAYRYAVRTHVVAHPANPTSPNPPFGALFTYYLPGDLPGAQLVLNVTDASGKQVRRLSGPARAGLQRVSWDLRAAPAAGGMKGFGKGRPGFGAPRPLVPAGKYQVTLGRVVKGNLTPIGRPQPLEVVALPEG
jgi:hypothetical protein